MSQVAATYSVREFISEDATDLSAVSAEVITECIPGQVHIEGGITLSDGRSTGVYFDHSIFAVITSDQHRINARAAILVKRGELARFAQAVLDYQTALNDAFDEAVADLDVIAATR